MPFKLDFNPPEFPTRPNAEGTQHITAPGLVMNNMTSFIEDLKKVSSHAFASASFAEQMIEWCRNMEKQDKPVLHDEDSKKLTNWIRSVKHHSCCMVNELTQKAPKVGQQPGRMSEDALQKALIKYTDRLKSNIKNRIDERPEELEKTLKVADSITHDERIVHETTLLLSNCRKALEDLKVEAYSACATDRWPKVTESVKGKFVLEITKSKARAKEMLEELGGAANLMPPVHAEQAGVIEEAPVGDAPVEHAPVEDAPVEHAPMKDVPMEDAPVGDTPVGDALVGDAPVEHAAVEDAPMGDAPVEHAPVGEAPGEGEQVPVEGEQVPVEGEQVPVEGEQKEAPVVVDMPEIFDNEPIEGLDQDRELQVQTDYMKLSIRVILTMFLGAVDDVITGKRKNTRQELCTPRIKEYMKHVGAHGKNYAQFNVNKYIKEQKRNRTGKNVLLYTELEDMWKNNQFKKPIKELLYFFRDAKKRANNTEARPTVNTLDIFFEGYERDFFLHIGCCIIKFWEKSIMIYADIHDFAKNTVAKAAIKKNMICWNKRVPKFQETKFFRDRRTAYQTAPTATTHRWIMRKLYDLLATKITQCPTMDLDFDYMSTRPAEEIDQVENDILQSAFFTNFQEMRLNF